MSDILKKTPNDVTEFEREQLRFFMSNRNLGSTLVEFNPSIAWLPLFYDLKLIGTERQLAPWIEKNFDQPDAIREVAANINFFGPETAGILEARLAIRGDIPPLLKKSWDLIIRHMRTIKHGVLSYEWFDIQPRVKNGEDSPELLERIADVLQPKPRVSRPYSISSEKGNRTPENLHELISVKYEIENGVSHKEVLSAWPENASPESDEMLINKLTHAINVAIEDASDVGLESSIGYGITDSDVVSVADHPQNEYRSGFLPIVRVTADLWTRLASKKPRRALKILDEWLISQFRLVRRLAIFAAANPVVPRNKVAKVLETIPLPELFLTNSTVEVFRLVDSRWSDLNTKQQRLIERRFIEGPPPEWFIEYRKETVDRCRFDILGHLQRNGNRLGSDAEEILERIKKEHPVWELRPKKQAGFHEWVETSSGPISDVTTLDDVSDEQLIPEAKKTADNSAWARTDLWATVCQTDIKRAFRGLEARAKLDEWSPNIWRTFLIEARQLTDSNAVNSIAKLMLDCPSESFREIAPSASWWLNDVFQSVDENLFWPLWDFILEKSLEIEETIDDMDSLTTSINHPAGRLVEILLKRVSVSQGESKLSEEVLPRLNKLYAAPAPFGYLARVRLALSVAHLFEWAPEWTQENLIPMFNWESSEAKAAWSARKYANYIGSPKLFMATKKPFLELFGRSEISDEDLRTYSTWLTSIMIANQLGEADYPITPTEARSAIRRAGEKCLPNIGHRLAIEMERADPKDKETCWQNVIGPVFESIWPLDVELQTSDSTFKLVQILRATGKAFPKAVELIIPFVRPEGPRNDTTIFSLSDADEELYSSSPEGMLNLVSALVDTNQEPIVHYKLEKVLKRILEHAPQLASSRKFQKLLNLANE